MAKSKDIVLNIKNLEPSETHTNIFAVASRNKYTYPHGRDSILTETLWALDVTILDSIAQDIYKKLDEKTRINITFLSEQTLDDNDIDINREAELLVNKLNIVVSVLKYKEDKHEKQLKLSEQRKDLLILQNVSTSSMTTNELSHHRRQMEDIPNTINRLEEYLAKA